MSQALRVVQLPEESNLPIYEMALGGETPQEFHAFLHYRDLPSDIRSVRLACRDHAISCRKRDEAHWRLQDQDGKVVPPGIEHWYEWKRVNQWDRRVIRFEADFASLRLHRRRKQLEQTEDEVVKACQDVRKKMMARVRQIKASDWPLGNIHQALKVLFETERKALGWIEKQQIEHTGDVSTITGAKPDLAGFSTDDLQMIKALVDRLRELGVQVQ